MSSRQIGRRRNREAHRIAHDDGACRNHRRSVAAKSQWTIGSRFNRGVFVAQRDRARAETSSGSVPNAVAQASRTRIAAE